MYCTKCGKEITDGASFCKYCGAAQLPLPTPNPNPKPAPKHNPLKPIIIALSVVLVVAVIAAAIIVVPLLKGNSKTEPQPWEHLSAGVTVAAVKNDGTVYCSDVKTDYEGTYVERYYDFSKWNEIKTISVDQMIAGLKNDGTVVVDSYYDYDYSDDDYVDEVIDPYNPTAYYENYLSSSELLNNIKNETSTWTDIKRVYTYEDDVFGIKSDGTVVCTSGVEYDLSNLKNVKQLACGLWGGTTYITVLFENGTVKVLYNNPEEGYDDSEFGEVDINKYNDWESWSGVDYISCLPYTGPIALKKNGTIVCSDLVNACYQDYIAKNPDDPDDAKDYVETYNQLINEVSGWQNVCQYDIKGDGWTGEMICVAVLDDGSLKYCKVKLNNGTGAQASNFNDAVFSNYSDALAVSVYDRDGILVLNKNGKVENLRKSDEIDVTGWDNVKTGEGNGTNRNNAVPFVTNKKSETETKEDKKEKTEKQTTEKQTEQKTTEKQTTAATTKSKTKSISDAYWDTVEEYENKYGTFSNTYPYVTGVCWLELIDFDADGTDELFIAYNSDADSDNKFKYDVYTYDGSDAKLIASRKLQTGDYDTAKTVEVFIENDTGKSYIYEVEDFEYDSVEGSLFTKEGNKFKEAYSLIMSESMYRLDRYWYDEDEFDEMFCSYTLDIGNEFSADTIADTKRMISNME